MNRRFYWLFAILAAVALSVGGVFMVSRITSAGGNSAGASTQACPEDDAGDVDPGEVDDAPEPGDVEEDGPDDAEPDCSGDEDDAADNDADDAADDDADEEEGTGQLGDGAELLSQASISVDEAIAAAQSTAQGPIGDVELENYQDKLVFIIEIGTTDVRVDALSGAIVETTPDD